MLCRSSLATLTRLEQRWDAGCPQRIGQPFYHSHQGRDCQRRLHFDDDNVGAEEVKNWRDGVSHERLTTFTCGQVLLLVEFPLTPFSGFPSFHSFNAPLRPPLSVELL